MNVKLYSDAETKLRDAAQQLADGLRFALSVLVEGKAAPRDVVEHAIVDARAALIKAGQL